MNWDFHVIYKKALTSLRKHTKVSPIFSSFTHPIIFAIVWGLFLQTVIYTLYIFFLCFIVLGVVFGSLIHFELTVLCKAQGTGRVSSLTFGWLITPSTIC